MPPTHRTALHPILAALALCGPAQAQEALGIGMVRPPIAAGARLYFFTPSDRDTPPGALAPVDSLVFLQGTYSLDAQGPPWLAPEVLKPDYELVWLRARAVTGHWIQVVVNPRGDLRWVDRAAVELVPWHEFLLDAVAVEPLDPRANPVRSAPIDNEPPMRLPQSYVLRPVEVRAAWIRVEVLEDLGGDPLLEGWLRWTDGARLLVVYSLLS